MKILLYNLIGIAEKSIAVQFMISLLASRIWKELTCSDLTRGGRKMKPWCSLIWRVGRWVWITCPSCTWQIFWTSFDSLDWWLHMWETLQWKTSVHYCEERRWVSKYNNIFHISTRFYESTFICLHWLSYYFSPGIFSKKSEGSWYISIVAWIYIIAWNPFIINTQHKLYRDLGKKQSTH